MPQEIKHDDLYVVIISNKRERNHLYELCVKYNIPILYPELFKEKKLHRLWGVSKTGVGLVATMVIRNTSEDHVLNAIDDLNIVIE